MNDMSREIRTLIAGLYDDPDEFLKRPHPWFGGRSPGEFMATEEGQFVLLKFLRGEGHILPIRADQDFKPYTAEAPTTSLNGPSPVSSVKSSG
jgi:hypothetical protein